MQRPTTLDFALLVLLAGIWGGSFVFIKIGVAYVAPAVLTCGRLVIGAAVLWLIVGVRRDSIRIPTGAIGVIVVAAFFNMSLPFYLISWGETAIDSNRAGILMAIMPMTTLVLAHCFSDEKATMRQFAGLVLGFFGVGVLMGPAAILGLGSSLIHEFAVAMGAVCYAISAILLRRLGAFNIPLMVQSVYLASAAAALGFVQAIIEGGWNGWDQFTLALPAIAFLGVFPTSLALVLLSFLIKRCGANFLALNNYLVPLMAVIWGVIVLAERPHWLALLALGIILSGIAVTQVNFGAKKQR